MNDYRTNPLARLYLAAAALFIAVGSAAAYSQVTNSHATGHHSILADVGWGPGTTTSDF
jgi:hypothetical protein